MNLRPIWVDSRPFPLDAGGPTDTPYDAASAAGFESVGGFEVIERTARRSPFKVAVDDGRSRLTYAAFLDRVYGLADRLASEAPRGAVVAALVHNSIAAPVITMACAMSGRILAPIDAGHPVERQKAIWSQTNACLVLLAAGETVDDSFIPASTPRLIVDPLAPTGVGRPDHVYDPEAPLFISFTSGSTGRPKGVVGAGRYGGMALRAFVDMFHLNPSDTVLGLASLSTGGSRDAFAALGAGALMRVFDIRTGLAEILRVLEAEEITVLSFIPSALRMILSVPDAETAFRHLRVLDLHGEKILASDIALFRQKLPKTCHISVTMGSVEAGAVFSWFVRDDLVTGTDVPVGYVMPGRAVTLLDESGAPVADGEVGELFVRGAMSMTWRDGGMTPGPLLADPDRPGDWIYPMGDLMRRRTDGLFEYVGRKDRRVKIRGLWADLGDVETAIRSLPDVADVAVISDGSADEAERLVAFIAPAAAGAPPTEAEVRRVVIAETAEHMSPSEIRFLESIPRLANLKPDLVGLDALLKATD